MLKEGDLAPDFELETYGGDTIKLSDLRGRRVVLYFYPKDDTPGCTKEACEFTAGIQDFRGLDARVLGCSPDGAEAHRKFIAKYDLDLTLLSDPEHRVMEKYGAWGEKSMYGRKSMGVIRSTVLIDPAGRVAHHWPRVKAAGHAEKVRDRLAELQTA